MNTLITHVRDNIAKGAILNKDLTTTPCYIVKQDNLFAHGRTLKEAQEALISKLFEGMPTEERISAFVDAHQKDKAYPNTDYFEWHHRLTGSCLIGRETFARDHEIDMTGSMTVAEFIRLTKNAYNGEIIKRLEQRYDMDLVEG